MAYNEDEIGDQTRQDQKYGRNLSFHAQVCLFFFFLYSTNGFAFIVWKKQFKHLLFKGKNDTIFKSIKTGHFWTY